jgi:hypothetical protein
VSTSLLTTFSDLPWSYPLAEWPAHTDRLVELPRGVSRHPVVFVNEDGSLYAFKELPPSAAEREDQLLRQIQAAHLPVVAPVGQLTVQRPNGSAGILVTRYLDRSLPYRLLFMRSSLVGYRAYLLDAIAGLLVQLHLAGVFWGDCSISNALFRRDAGALQAYLVDAETAEVHAPPLQPVLRHHDLQIMEENLTGELEDLAAAGLLSADLPGPATSAHIRRRYQQLWDEIRRAELIAPGEHYRIQERINALNALGFSVGEVSLVPGEAGERMLLHVVVTDRNFHRNQLHSLTGLDVEERQAQKMMNEIQELRAHLDYTQNRTTPLAVAANQWLENIFQPTLQILAPLVDPVSSPAELYCQVLEHKWYLSERAHHDVGHQHAARDYLENFQSG